MSVCATQVSALSSLAGWLVGLLSLQRVNDVFLSYTGLLNVFNRLNRKE